VAIRAAFFDVGDTLVEHWIPTEETLVKTRERVCAAIGERPWLDEWLDIRDLEPRWNVSLANAIVRRADDRGRFEPEEARQETLRWQRAWFEERGIDTEDIDLDDLRSTTSPSCRPPLAGGSARGVSARPDDALLAKVRHFRRR